MLTFCLLSHKNTAFVDTPCIANNVIDSDSDAEATKS
jgi:hypothetical protein